MKLPEGSVTANEAWLALVASILTYEVIAPEGELLSESVDRAINKHPILTIGAIAITAAHLTNMFDVHPTVKQFDPYHQVFRRLRSEL